jgi:hypothetical protein
MSWQEGLLCILLLPAIYSFVRILTKAAVRSYFEVKSEYLPEETKQTKGGKDV